VALTDILGKLGGQEGQQGAINAIAKVFGGTGVQGILTAMHQNGLGQQAKSWTGPGKNQPISGADVKKMANPQLLAQMAKQHNESSDELCEQIARVLPDVVEKATHDGQVPSQGGAQHPQKKKQQGSASDALAGALKKK
jgi:uncharacterized protein YidB (DUF937 family)